MTDFGLCIYHSVEMSSFDLLQNGSLYPHFVPNFVLFLNQLPEFPYYVIKLFIFLFT